MDDPGAFSHVPARDPALEQGVHERAVSVPCRRLDDDACRLVDDEQMFVLVSDFELSFLGLQAAVDLVWNLEFDDLPALEAPALGPPLAVYTDRTGREQPFSLGPRADRRQRGNEAVEPLSRSLWGNLKPFAHLEPGLARLPLASRALP